MSVRISYLGEHRLTLHPTDARHSESSNKSEGMYNFEFKTLDDLNRLFTLFEHEPNPMEVEDERMTAGDFKTKFMHNVHRIYTSSERYLVDQPNLRM